LGLLAVLFGANRRFSCNLFDDQPVLIIDELITIYQPED